MTDNQVTNYETTEYLLEDYGLNVPINIVGELEQLLPRLDVPIVFLIDEFHAVAGKTNACIEQNIFNALELISKCNIGLIGVESHPGGDRWDSEQDQYATKPDPDDPAYALGFLKIDEVFDTGDTGQACNNCPAFANRMRANTSPAVLGVECVGLLDGQYFAKINKNPERFDDYNRMRSEHFLRTLFKLCLHRSAKGNLILNAGWAHNNDIVELILSGDVEKIAGRKAAYVRITTPAFTSLFQTREETNPS